MKKLCLLLSVITIFCLLGCPQETKEGNPKTPTVAAPTTDLHLNEGDLGFISAYNGTTTATIKELVNAPGYENKFIEGLGVGSNIKFAVNANKEGKVKLSIRYAFWGTKTEIRAAYIYIDGQLVNEANPIFFPYTQSNKPQNTNIWQESEAIEVTFPAGNCFIEIKPVPAGTPTPNALFNESVVSPEDIPAESARLSSGKLPNFDYLHLVSEDPELLLIGTDDATKYWNISTSVNNSNYGTITSVEQSVTDGKSITIKATPATGYKFDCWTGSHPSNAQEYTLTATSDIDIQARFIPENATMPEGLIGYGACADLEGKVTYTLTGGFGGEEVNVTTLEELEAALTSDNPKIIYIESQITTPTEASTTLTAGSNKTLMSKTGNGHIKNIEIKLNGENYIVKNLHFSEVEANLGTGNDALKIGGGKYVWIDHCEFNSNTTVDKDYYDGLLDITNGARSITISNSYFHDHWKAILCGSGDGAANQISDKNIRLTMHHNYFKNIGSRTPLLRYGKAHIFNNYWNSTLDDSSAINARAGAEVLVENNVFNGIEKALGFYFEESSSNTGKWNVSGNNYGSASGGYCPTASTTDWKPKYSWKLDDTSSLESSIPTTAGVIKH